MRCVLDTDVLLAGLRSAHGASRQVLARAGAGQLDLVVSVPLVLEWESVLKRPEHLAAMGLTGADIDAVIDLLIARARLVEIFFVWRPQASDPNDDMVIETAVNGAADTIVSFNSRHLSASATRFGIQVLGPASLLERWR